MNAETEVPETAVPPDAGQDQDWLQFLQLTTDVGEDLGQLLLLEVRLALNSLGRMVFLALAALPLVLLAWLALSLLPAVVVYDHTGSAALGVALFLLIQLLSLGALCIAWVCYRRTLSLPHTRRQVRAFTGGGRDGT